MFGFHDPRIDDIAFVDDCEVVAVDEVSSRPAWIVLCPESVNCRIGLASADEVRAVCARVTPNEQTEAAALRGVAE